MKFFQFRHIYFSIVFGLMFFLSNAQQSNTLYFMKEAYQASFLNPAFSQGKDFVIGLPFISGLNLGFNNDFKINDVTLKGYGLFSDTLKFDFNSFYDVLSNQNKISFEADISMFYIGVKAGKNNYSVSVNEKMFFRGNIDKRFIEYFKKGTKPYYGENADLGILSFIIDQYREFGFGVSRQVNKKFTYGAKLKLLFGRMNLKTNQLGFQIKSSVGNNLLLVHPSGTVDISGPVKFETDTVQKSTRLRNDLHTADYFFNFKNLSLATDLGFNYQVNKQFSFSASLTDLGFLKFAKKNYIMDAGFDLEYKKEKLTQATDPSAYDYFSGNNAIYAFRDSIPFMTSAAISEKTQWVNLPVKLYAGANYQVNRNLTLGFVEKLFFLKNYFYSATTFSAQTNLSANFSLTGSYSVLRNSYFNLGVGGIYNSKIMQIYFATDNIFSLIIPSNVKNLNLQAGINLIISKE
jgi:hypothetical protein